MSNLVADLPATLPEELIEVLAGNPNVRIERIVSTGHASPEGFMVQKTTGFRQFKNREMASPMRAFLMSEAGK